MSPPKVSTVEAAVTQLLNALKVADDPAVTGTPNRVAELWTKNLLVGYQHDPAVILNDTIPDVSGAVVSMTSVPFHTICPHHLTPTFGVIHLAYEPDQKIVGLGVLERLIFTLSRRLVLQEDLGRQLVDALMEHLGARGAACAIEATHLCLNLRGREPRSARVSTRIAVGTLLGCPDVLPPVSA